MGTASMEKADVKDMLWVRVTLLHSSVHLNHDGGLRGNAAILYLQQKERCIDKQL